MEGIVQDLELRAPQKPKVRLGRPWIFIAHGGETPARDHLELFLWRQGYHPVIVDIMPSLQMSINDKVDHYLKQCSFAVIFAEADRASTQDGKTHPRLNIVNEIPRVRNILGKKFIVLIEKGLSMPSNENDAVHDTFNQDNLERVFLVVQSEMNAHGITGISE